MKYRDLEIREYDCGNIYIIDKAGHGWEIQWEDETTIRLMHCNRRSLSGGTMHTQRYFTEMSKEDLHIIFKYVWNHQNYELNRRHKPKKSHMDYLFDMIKK